MNLLFVINKYPNYGGTEVVTTTLANAFIERGCGVGILSFIQVEPDLLKDLDVRVKLHEFSHPVGRRLNKARLHSILKDDRIDFILNQWCLPFYVTRFCRAAMQGTSCKLISIHHNAPDQNSLINEVKIKIDQVNGFSLFNFFYFMKLKFLTYVTACSMRYVYRYSDRYVVLSESFISIFEQFTKVKKASKLLSIGNPLTLDDAPISVTKENLILYVGRIDHNQKRVERVLEIWEELVLKLPEWKLEIVGDGPDRARLEMLSQSRSIPRISFEGYSDPAEYYNRASVLLLTSEYEGFGLVIVEAMACGCVPVVLGSYSSVYDIIQNGVNGFIVDTPYDRKAFSLTVERLVQDRALRCGMSRAAIESVDRFSLLNVVDEWEKMLEELKA